MKKIAFLGAGTFSDGVFPFLDPTMYEFVGYFDDKPIKEYKRYPILGKLSESVSFLEKGLIDCVFITIGDNEKRKEVFELVAENHYSAIINIISPHSSIFSKDSIKGRGIFLGFSSFIGSESVVYDNCIINTGAIVEHHSVIGSHCNIAPGSTINGLCQIGEGTYVGSGAVIIQCIKIPSFTTIGAGCVVTKDILESGTYVGVPAKKIK